MDAPVCLEARIADGSHVDFFLRKMLHRMVLEIFNSLLINPLTFLLLPIGRKQLIHNAEKFPVFPVNKLYPNIEPILPY